MKIEAAPSLKLWAVTVWIKDTPYRIPPQPAAAWLRAIGSHNLSAVVPGMLEDREGGDDLLDLVMEGDITVKEWHAAAHDAITAITGMKWWTAARVTHYLLEHWSTLGGAVISRGLDPAVAPVGAVLTLAYRILLENCKDEGERSRLDRELEKPPTGVPVAEMYDPKQAEANFMALANAPG